MGFRNICLHPLTGFQLLFILTITACVTLVEDPELDRSFLSDSPCAAPCWYGLEPGITTEETVLKKLKELPFVDIGSINISGTKWQDDDTAKSIHFGCIHPQRESCGDLLISGDTLKRLSLSVGYPLTMKMVIDKLGVPDYLDYGPFHPEAGGCVILLAWPDRGISTSTIDTKYDSLCRGLQEHQDLPANGTIDRLNYSVSEAFSSKPGGWGQRIEWPGFGDQ